MITLKINGKSHTVDASPDMPLLWVLRDLLGMNGTKFGCGAALCGACTVHLDGIPRRSCVMPVSAAAGHSITTIEGVGDTATGQRVQQAWLDLEVIHSAATASPARSWPPPRCSRRYRRPPTPISTRRCPGTFAAAAPIPASERPSNRRLANRQLPRRRADHGPDVASPAPLHGRGRRRRIRAGAASRGLAARVGGNRRRDSDRLRAKRLYSHRQGRPDHADHEPGRDGTGHLHLDAHVDRGRAGGGTGRGPPRARAAQRQAVREPDPRRY